MAGAGTNFLTFVAFGPVFGPHIAFAGGVAAAAYAARTGKDVGGKDIGVPLISIERPDVLLVGAGFGMFGYVVQFGISKIPWFGTHTDSVALTVILSAFIVRLAFGRTSIFGNLPDGAGWGRFAPRDDAAWVRWHERFVPNTVLGLFAGLLAAGLQLKLAEFFPVIASVANLRVLQPLGDVAAVPQPGPELPGDPPHHDHRGPRRADVPADRRRQRHRSRRSSAPCSACSRRGAPSCSPGSGTTTATPTSTRRRLPSGR